MTLLNKRIVTDGNFIYMRLCFVRVEHIFERISNTINLYFTLYSIFFSKPNTYITLYNLLRS